jgi:hypothetical protein
VLRAEARQRELPFVHGSSFGFRGHRFECIVPSLKEGRGLFKVAMGYRSGWGRTAVLQPPGLDPFDPYRDSEYEDEDRYHVLQSARMPDDLRAAIFAGTTPAGTRPGDYYVQVNRYDRGDYVLPHRDSLQQGLYMLTTTGQDGLNAQHDRTTMVFVPDRAGTFVGHDPHAWHWVDPVAAEERYTLVTIPPLPHRSGTEPDRLG